jgi:hypothetical protein
MVFCCQSGCVATKYKLAKRNTPPVEFINITFPSSPLLQVTLASFISDGAPGSWKREALWDEYVVTLENRGDLPLAAQVLALVDVQVSVVELPAVPPDAKAFA